MAKKTAKKFPASANPKRSPMYTGKASKADPVTRKRGTGLVKKTGSRLPDAKGGSGRPV